MAKQTSKRIVLVTGATRGLGLATAQALAKQGDHVVLAGRKSGPEIEAVGEFFELDVSDERSIAHFVKEFGAKHNHLDVLINNAGVFLDAALPRDDASFFSVSSETVLRTFKTNTLGPFLLCQGLVPFLKKSPAGRIVNISSGMGGLTEMEGGYPAYRMSKVALNAITRILAVELEETPIKINSVCPGWVRTDMGGPSASRSLEEGIRGILWAANLPPSGPSGGFFRDGERIEW